MTLDSQKILGSYSRTGQVFDEFIGPDDQPRNHWRRLAESLDEMGPGELQARADEAARLVREHGITYHVYDDPQGVYRPAELEPVPFMLDFEEWKRLENGLAQRARLLNAILSDIYGDQELLRNKDIPAAMIFSHQGFLRSCHGTRPPGDIWLNFYAVDLSRSPDGRWWVISDRTQAPSGAGYALENRIITAQVLNPAFRRCRVTRLAPFFSRLIDAARELAAMLADPPTGAANIALLSPGPLNETYFEHAFLARYLNFSLIEGADLTVRENKVYMKTLGGLERVHVLLRRMDDSFCDPLWLRSESMIGVPGLVDAARTRSVAIMNPLGSGLGEMPAIMSILPGLCRKVLGEDLMIPSVATWWCGQPEPKRQVIDNFNRLTILPATPGLPFRPVSPGQLDQESRYDLEASLHDRPFDYIAQERVSLSNTPVWDGDALQPRPLTLRVFLVWNNGEWHAMPGGLTRITNDADSPVVTMQRGGMAKDTWVPSLGQMTYYTLLPQKQQAVREEVREVALLSRVADNFFWLGRYLERLDALCRLLRVAASRMVDERRFDASEEIGLLLPFLFGRLSIEVDDDPKSTGLGAEIGEAIWKHCRDAGQLDSLPALVQAIHLTADLLRPRLADDMWRTINRLKRDIEEQTVADEISPQRLIGLLNSCLTSVAAVTGFESETMTRSQGWRFLDIGRRLERATWYSALIRSVSTAALDNGGRVGIRLTVALDLLLELCDSFMTYRTRYMTLPEFPLVVDLLVKDQTNPRSVAYQLERLALHCRRLPGEPVFATEMYEWVADVADGLQQIDIPRLHDNDQETLTVMQEALEETESRLPAISDRLTLRYFAHSVSQTSMQQGQA
jgi:uncharacterized circularly permuted ATP-grasp superfamily protein/uncharacterized alpha-E superfamily protein